MSNDNPNINLNQKIVNHISAIYHDVLSAEDKHQLADNIQQLTEGAAAKHQPSNRPLWDEKSTTLITYGNSLVKEGELPLTTLLNFTETHFSDAISTVHILPFFTYSSDDGFSVKDFYQVNPTLGDWSHVTDFTSSFAIMADIVMNHGSAQGEWFQNYLQGKAPGDNYFFSVDPARFDSSKVKRTRTTTLLNPVNHHEGTKYVWCTFSPDQVDFNFQNPDVLVQFIDVLFYYLEQGISIFRLDAVGFLWKTTGTTCLSLEQTHEIIRLFRTLLHHVAPSAMLITETNIPHEENMSYLGKGDEAHAIYNFALPPLLISTLLSGNCHHLRQWMQSMPKAQPGTTYFNFIASHDGVGLRPIEDLLTIKETHALIKTLANFGGDVSYRTATEGGQKPYEVNIALVDALKGTHYGADEFMVQRFLCAHAIMIAMAGIPGIYIHSLLGTKNDYEGIEQKGHKRAINRHQWHLDTLLPLLKEETSEHHQICAGLTSLLKTRRLQPAFHPDANQRILDLGNDIVGFLRQVDTQTIYCFYNISLHTQLLPLADLLPNNKKQWLDLLQKSKAINPSDCIVLAPYQAAWLSNR